MPARPVRGPERFRGGCPFGAGAPRGDVPDGVLRLAPAGGTVQGYDLLGPGAELPAGVEPMTAAQLRAHDVEHGVAAERVLGEDPELVAPKNIGILRTLGERYARAMEMKG